MKKPIVDYRKLRLSNLNSPEFKHVKLLLYWPVYGLLFLFVERFYQPGSYYSIHCALDDLIPFNELFLLPYLFWFVFLTGMLVYTFFYDTECFSRMMKFIILTYTAALLTYLIFPNCQHLRPKSFERDNILTRFMAWFYRFDTDTNVCPSLHVIGSLAVMFAAWNTPAFRAKGWKRAFTLTAALICVSTVFVKQHSVLDILAALPLCAIAYPICFKTRAGSRQEKKWTKKPDKTCC